jgi:hypothetical protein
VVHDVVELGAQAVDVLPVERRDERRVDLLIQLVRDGVAVVLHLDQALADRLHVGARHGDLGEQFRRGDVVLRGATEELEDGALGGAERKLHDATSM